MNRIYHTKIGLYILFVFTYITYALIYFFFLLKMKDELTSGMPEDKTRVFVLFGFFWLVWGRVEKIIKVEFSDTALKRIIEVFQHFTLSNFLSCGNSLFHVTYYWGTNQICSLFVLIFFNGTGLLLFMQNILTEKCDFTWFWTSSFLSAF